MRNNTQPDKVTPQADVVFEISWEVCNKIGGIYTVIVSKVPLMMEYYKNYYLIGPYFEDKAKFEIEPASPSLKFNHVFQTMEKKYNIKCYYGIWKIQGEPKVILVDSRSLIPKKNEIKKRLWETYKIDSLRTNWDFEEPMIWSEACGLLLCEMEPLFKNEKVVVHCHEWLSGFTLLNLKMHHCHARTVFTTHATMLGRAIAGITGNLYERLDEIDPDKESYNYQVEGKHTTEKACALNADAFTTVSEITALEATKFFGRTPDITTPNGLIIKKFPSYQEIAIKHISSRERIREFLKYYFLPYYKSFNLAENLCYFISCRYEFRNKGIDTFIEALGRLNKKLQEDNTERTITAFFWIPMATRGIRSELRENKDYYEHIKRYVEKNASEILTRIIDDFMSLQEPTEESIFSKDFMTQMRKEVLHFKRTGNPPLLTHYIDNERDDIIINTLLANGLDNRESNKVKVVVYPIYLTGDDPLIGLPYYDAIAGCHLGVFPSIYEPWGYTPLEAAAMGVPSVTTDLSGFASLIKPALPKENPGIYILECYKKTREEIVNGLFNIMYNFSRLTHEERVENKMNAKKLARLSDWETLIENYIKAHNIALSK